MKKFGFLSLVVILCLFSLPVAAKSILDPGDIVITTMNTDGSSPTCTTHGDGFEFLTRVDVNTGVVIHFTDNAVTNTGGWRATEGTISYTATSAVPAGTFVYYDNCKLTSEPTKWSRNGSWDPAGGGDNLIAYQGTMGGVGSAIRYLYAIGIASNSPWITSGTPTANNSYLPAGLSLGTTAISLTPSSSKNGQYNCTSPIDLDSPTILSILSNSANWKVGAAGTNYGTLAGSCVVTSTPIPPHVTLTGNLFSLPGNYLPLGYVHVGYNIGYTFTVSNIGGMIPDLILTHYISPSQSGAATYLSGIITAGTYNTGSGIWSVGVLASGSQQSMTTYAKVNVIGDWDSEGIISFSGDTINTGDSKVGIKYSGVALDNWITMSGSATSVQSGSEFSYTINYGYNGEIPMTGAIAFTLPYGYTITSTSNLSYTPITGGILWSGLVLSHGMTGTIVLTGIVQGWVNTTFTGTALIGDTAYCMKHYLGSGNFNGCLEVTTGNNIASVNTMIMGSVIPTTGTKSVLEPGDIVITTANADTTFSTGSCSDPSDLNNAFEFLTRVNIATGTVIYFTDSAYTSTGGWRAGEGTIIYTADRLIPAGTFVDYKDCKLDTHPTIWKRVGEWDPAVNGDTLMAYQGVMEGTGNSIHFLYGIGWGSATPWTTTGPLTANNSYLPSQLTLGTTATKIGGSTWRNVQYMCNIPTSIYDTDFLQVVSNPVNWTGGGAGIYFSPLTNLTGSAACNMLITRADLVVTGSVFNTTGNYLPVGYVNQNGLLGYTMTVTNMSGFASGVILSNIIPSDVAYVSSIPSVGSYDPISGTRYIGNINSGDSYSLTVYVQSLVTGAYSITGDATSASIDVYTGNNTTVLGYTGIVLDSWVTMTGSTGGVESGQVFSYTIDYGYSGSITIPGAIALMLPNNFAITSTSLSGYTTISGGILWSGLSFVDNTMGSIYVTGIVTGPVGTNFVSKASIGDDTYCMNQYLLSGDFNGCLEITTGNNESSVNAIIVAPTTNPGTNTGSSNNGSSGFAGGYTGNQTPSITGSTNTNTGSNNPQTSLENTSISYTENQIFNNTIADKTCYTRGNILSINGLSSIKNNEFYPALLMLYNYELTKYNTPDEYQPYSLLTRQQAAKLFVQFAKNVLCRTPQNIAIAYKDTDYVDPTLKPYIQLAYQYGLMRGYPKDQTFRPYDNISMQEFMTVLVRLGLASYLPEEGATWSTNYMTVAKQEKLILNSTASYLSRRNAAISLFRAYKNKDYIRHTPGYLWEDASDIIQTYQK